MDICNKSNIAISCNGNNFISIDEGTQEAIVSDLASFLMISYDDADDIARCLYYEPYYEGTEFRVRYTIPKYIVSKLCR